MGLFSRLSGECMCPPWLTLHSKDEAGYFDPLDTPGFLGDVCQVLLRPEAASYVNQSGKGCTGTNIPPSGFSRKSMCATLVRLVCPRLWWAYKLCFGCQGIPCSNHCRLARVFPGCVLYRLCTLLCMCGGGCVPGLAVGCALTGFIYRKRECWLVFLSASSCVFAIFAAVRCRIHARLCLEGFSLLGKNSLHLEMQCIVYAVK